MLNDYGLSVLEQYGMEGADTRRTRGALLCQKGHDLYILRAFTGSVRKLEKEQELLLALKENSRCRVDFFLENKEGGLVSTDREGSAYTLQKWYEGRECDTKSGEDIRKSAAAMADLHNVMYLPLLEDYEMKSLQEEYERHNRELRKILKFIRKKGAANPFEKLYLSSADWFLEKGEEALEQLEKSGYEELRKEARERGSICHGEYNQHNVLILRNGVAVTSFSHWNFDIQTADLYRFLRKILEKYNWDQRLGEDLLREYEKYRPLRQEEKENLRIRFLYPEKYWKLANYYFSHNKAWISGKNVEKLNKLILQKDAWEDFGKKSFRINLF